MCTGKHVNQGYWRRQSWIKKQVIREVVQSQEWLKHHWTENKTEKIVLARTSLRKIPAHGWKEYLAKLL